MATKIKPGAEEPTLRSRRQRRPKRELGHGNWKLVYADFVTVLMAFFLVCWILLYNLLSEIEPVDNACIKQMAEELNKQIDNDKQLKRGAIPIQIDLEPLGLRLTLLDNSQPMFQTGGTSLSPFAKEQFSKIAIAVNMCPQNKLRIEGYTDATPYAAGATGYGNWELSTERANSARRELLSKEVLPTRISQVIGYGDSRPSIPENPMSPLNRRISITVLPRETKKQTTDNPALLNLIKP
jgi:chemotaxis protein MotB